jgi:hypothetical protein
MWTLAIGVIAAALSCTGASPRFSSCSPVAVTRVSSVSVAPARVEGELPLPARQAGCRRSPEARCASLRDGPAAHPSPTSCSRRKPVTGERPRVHDDGAVSGAPCRCSGEPCPWRRRGCRARPTARRPGGPPDVRQRCSTGEDWRGTTGVPGAWGPGRGEPAADRARGQPTRWPPCCRHTRGGIGRDPR